ncbi:MAG TPA: rhodanese-like domain-containing protein [Firmicutes bacterium]|nr:rhodanese-like domain-containing protein [Bacillota bacterium]
MELLRLLEWRIGLQVLVLGVVSIGLAAVTNAVRPNRLAWVIDPKTSVDPGENPELAEQVAISLEELREHLMLGTAAFVDARKPEEYAEAHLATAINIPSTQKEHYLDVMFEMLPLEGVIIIYCEGGGCESSNVVFKFLVDNGYPVENLKMYMPGWEALGELDDLPIVYGTD